MRSNRAQMHMVSLQTVTDEAIEFIRAHEPPEGYFVAFSGGKDSIVTLELTRMAGVKHQAFYSATGIDPPEVVRFIRRHYPDVKWLRPKMTFWDGIQRNDPPMRWQRWCCRILKKNFDGIALKHDLLGIRAEESVQRKMHDRFELHSKLKRWNYKPIFHWKTWHIWDFIEGMGLSYPILYDEGWDRIGCIVCPMHCHKNMAQIKRNKSRWPGVFRAFEHSVTRWFNAKRAGHDNEFSNANEYVQAWYRGFE